ncbi:MAG: YidH family protein [Rhodanobacteraceae bacterium]
MPEQESAEYRARVREIVELQAEVCYMNVDRTLATWTRTALSMIAFGALVDRFGLLLIGDEPTHLGTRLAQNPLSTVGGLCLIAIGLFVALSTGIRHQAYRRTWIREYGHPGWRGPWLALVFSMMTAVVGLALLAILLVLRH